MKQSQKNYDSFHIINIINKSKSIEYHRKNLFKIQTRKNKLFPIMEKENFLEKNKTLNNKTNTNCNKLFLTY